MGRDPGQKKAQVHYYLDRQGNKKATGGLSIGLEVATRMAAVLLSSKPDADSQALANRAWDVADKLIKNDAQRNQADYDASQKGGQQGGAW